MPARDTYQRATFLRVVVLHTSRETKEHEEHTYRDINGPAPSPAVSLPSDDRFNPSEPYDGERNGTALPRVLARSPPESISRTAIKHRDVSSTLVRDRARLINSCRTRPESSCPHFVARRLRGTAENCLFSGWKLSKYTASLPHPLPTPPGEPTIERPCE